MGQVNPQRQGGKGDAQFECLLNVRNIPCSVFLSAQVECR